MTHYNPDDWGHDDDPEPEGQFKTWAVIIAISLIVLCVTAFTAEGQVIITDEHGQLIRTCVSPVELVPGQGAIICKTPTKVFQNGFENGPV